MPVPIFDVNSHIVDYIPRKKRKLFWIAWLKGLSSQINRLNIIFNNFRNGSVDNGYWSNIISYSIGDRIRTINGVFESIIDSNLNNNPLTDDGSKWIKILDNFIGRTEELSFNSSKLILEYKLNREFQGNLTDNGFSGYKQPTTINPGVGYTPLSDIYISELVPVYNSFVSFLTEVGTSNVFTGDTENNVVFTNEHYSGITSFQSVINIPISVFNSLGSSVEIRTSVVMNFVNKVKRAGIFYTIQTY